MRQHCNEWYAFWLVFALPFLIGAATTASQITDVRVVQTGAHQTRIVVTSSGPTIAGWKLIGAGTTDIALVLPNTSVATPPPSLARAAGSVSSFDFTANGTQLYATFHLTGLVTATAAQSGSTITIVLKDTGRSSVQRTQPRLTTPQPATGTSFEVIPLKYADVSEVAGVLVAGQQMTPNDLFQTQGSIFTLPSSAGGAQPIQNQQTYSTAGQPSARSSTTILPSTGG